MMGQTAQVMRLAVADDEAVVRQSMLRLADRVMHIHQPFRSNLLELLTDMVTRSELSFSARDDRKAEGIHD